MESKFDYGTKVGIRKAIKAENLHYGYLDDLDLFKLGTGIVMKAHFSINAGCWSYQVKFEGMQMDNIHWFVEGELYEKQQITVSQS